MDNDGLSPKKIERKVFSQLAELHVAGLFAAKGWRVYFPHQDDGFDFIALKNTDDGLQIRPVKVKGKYPEDEKSDKQVYGFVGGLTQKHRDMVLAIPYFERGKDPIIKFVAFMPHCMIRPRKCEPARFAEGTAHQRREYAKYFGQQGLLRVENTGWFEDSLKGTD